MIRIFSERHELLEALHKSVLLVPPPPVHSADSGSCMAPIFWASCDQKRLECQLNGGGVTFERRLVVHRVALMIRIFSERHELLEAIHKSVLLVLLPLLYYSQA